VRVATYPATSDRFQDVATILAPRKPDTPACWCLYYRLSSADSGRLTPRERPRYLAHLCARDVAPGILAYVDGDPAGWCAVGPRSDFARLRTSRTIPTIDDAPAWSVVCFVVRAAHRRKGVAHALLEGAVAYAASRGATVVEGYPVDTEGARISGSFVYVGTVALFERAGFTRVIQTSARSGNRPRWLMRRSLTG
jgi:GNAT superfamily N-acetyltransferase